MTFQIGKSGYLHRDSLVRAAIFDPELPRDLMEQLWRDPEALIVGGTAEVRRNKRKVATLGPGACVGELALLDHKPRTASVIAATDLTVLVIGAREFAGIVDNVPSISHKLMRSLASRVRELDAQAYG